MPPAVPLPDPRRRTPEVGLDFAREWLEFPDPADPGVLFRCDLTFLLSSWGCIFGRGCPGTVATAPDAGCCGHGAFFAGRDDERTVRAAAAQMGPQVWQHAQYARRHGLAQRDGGRLRTRVVHGACVFANRAGFPGGAGCALHAHALATGRHPSQTKPAVCWQVPLRRTFDRRTRPDDTSVQVVTIGEYDRRGWGPGGHDLDWWCTSSPDAHGSADPVVVGMARELTVLMGEPAYAVLLAACQQRRAKRDAVVHPASAAASTDGAGGAGRPGRCR